MIGLLCQCHCNILRKFLVVVLMCIIVIMGVVLAAAVLGTIYFLCMVMTRVAQSFLIGMYSDCHSSHF